MTSPEQVTTSIFELVQYNSEDAWKTELEANGVELPEEDEELDSE